MTINQNRITLKKLKVAEFASEETLCFNAVVYFDGVCIAEASNDGWGGQTALRPLNDMGVKLHEAMDFAKSIPPIEAGFNDPNNPDQKAYLDVTLDFLVEIIANDMHNEKRNRSAFKRDLTNKVIFILEGKLLYLKGVNIKKIADKTEYFKALHSKYSKKIIILAELPTEEAFALWKQHAIA